MHWTQTPNGRKRMSQIAKNRAARVRANFGAAPLQLAKSEQQEKESAAPQFKMELVYSPSLDSAIQFCEDQIKQWTENLELAKRIKWCMEDLEKRTDA